MSSVRRFEHELGAMVRDDACFGEVFLTGPLLVPLGNMVLLSVRQPSFHARSEQEEGGQAKEDEEATGIGDRRNHH